MSKSKKRYEVSGPGPERVTVEATDSRDARRKGASAIRKQYGMDYKDSALNVRCLEGQPASTPPSKAPSKKPESKAKAKSEAPTTSVPPIQNVVGWVLYYVEKGVEWLNANSK